MVVRCAHDSTGSPCESAGVTSTGAPADGDAAVGVFAAVVAPWVTSATGRLADVLASLPGEAVDRPRLVAGFGVTLGARLERWVTPVLVHELHRRRSRGTLIGTDGRERFAAFVGQIATPTGRAVLLADYPVLARDLDRECVSAVASTAELATRYTADQERIAEALTGAVRSAMVAVHPSGDRHHGGRATSVVELADGSRVVHKPRGVAAHLCLTALVALINRLVPGLELDTVDAVAGTECGWTEYVRPAPLSSPDRADTYFHRLGGLLALLHLVRATDIHHQNLIARGDQPLVVDVETLFHPTLSDDPADPATAALARSVARTGVLPAVAGRHGLTDVSGVGGDAGQETVRRIGFWVDAGTDRMRRATRPGQIRGAVNQPVCAGRPVEAADHTAAVLAGFRQVYDAMTRHRAVVARELRQYAEIPVRVVVRPTRQYADLLAATNRPALLCDPAARRHALLSACTGLPPAIAALAEHEMNDLDAGDIPLFAARADGHDLEATGGRLSGVLTDSGLADALACLADFNEFDRHDQEWVIKASLASRRNAVTANHPGPAPVATSALDTDEVLSAACAVGDRLVTASFGAHRVNWIGLEPVDDTRWLVLPMGAGLAYGYTGVALFLAQLSMISKVTRYADIARRALDAVPDLLCALRGRPDLVAAVGVGGLTGFGGVGYALARLAVLLDDREVAGWARATVPLAAEAATLVPGRGWADGLDGCAAAMRALDAEIGGAEALELANYCAGGDRDDEEPNGPAQWCRHGTGGRQAVEDLSLCHGELGRADLSAAHWSMASRRHRAGVVLATLRRNGPQCVTPDGVVTPGLLTGLAGIGHGLLRLGFPDRVPSVLRLEPSRVAAASLISSPGTNPGSSRAVNR